MSSNISFTDYFIIFIVVILLFFYIKGIYAEVEYKKADDGQLYLVRKISNSQQAADYLADIGNRLENIVKHYLAKYPDSEDAKLLFENFNKHAISEGTSTSGYTSYSVNKGERIVLCIRQDDDTFVDKNVTMYVGIHELAHLACSELNHTDLFWQIMKKLLKEAVEIGEYKVVDYAKNPVKYCGITISHSII